MSSNKEPVTPPATTAKTTVTAIRKPRKTNRGKTQQDSEAESSGYVSTHEASADEPGDNNDFEETPIPRDKGKQPIRNPPETLDTLDTHTMMQFMMNMQQQLTNLQTQMGTRQRPQTPPSPSRPVSPSHDRHRIDEEDLIERRLTRFRRDIKGLLPPKPNVTLQGSDNYLNWRQNLLQEANLIDAKEILDLEQDEVPRSLDEVEAALWQAKSQILYSRITMSLSPKARYVTQDMDAKNPIPYWQRLYAHFGTSPAEERLNLIRSLASLRVRNGDYPEALQRYRSYCQRLKQMNVTSDDMIHDLFLTMLGNYSQDYVQLRLDTHFADSRQGKVRNMDIWDLSESLLFRHKDSRTNNSKPKQPQAASTTSSSSSHRNNRFKAKTKDNKKCGWCGSERHIDEKCRLKHPELASTEWCETNKDRIEEYKKKNAAKAPVNLNKNSRQPLDLGIAHTVQPSTTSRIDKADIAHNAIAYVVTKASHDWLLDTCASYHMTSDRDAFVTYEPIADAGGIKDANGGWGPIAGIGTVLLQIGDAILPLKQVRYVPTLKSNLVSYAYLENQGFDLSLSSGVTPKHHIIRSPDGDEFYAYKTDLNVYRLNDATPTLRQDSKAIYSAVEWNDIDSTACGLASIGTPIPTRKRSEVTPQTMTISQWHQRLCHLNQWDIIRLSKDPATGVKIKGPKSLPFCEYCQKGKQTRHYPKAPAPPATRPMTRVFLDIAGGGKTLGVPDDEELPSRTGCRYFLMITDDATRLRWIFFLPDRSHLLPVLKWWLNWMKSQGYSTPAFVHADNEICTNEVKEFALDEGFKLELTNPDSPHQNGPSERGNRIVISRGRTMLLDSNLPLKFWADALETAVQMSNHLPTSVPLYNDPTPGGTNQNPDISPSQHIIPACAWSNAPPDTHFFYKWGSPVTYHLHGSSKRTPISSHL